LLLRLVAKAAQYFCHVSMISWAEVADFEVAVVVDEDVRGLEIAMDDACRVDIFQAALSQISIMELPKQGCEDEALPESGPSHRTHPTENKHPQRRDSTD
jgi:hypothetical protein